MHTSIENLITNITITSLGYNARAVLLCRNHGEFFVVTSFLTTKQLLPFLLDLKKNTLDSGIDVAPGINVAPGTSGKNIKRSP